MKAAFFDVDGTLTDVRVWQGVMDYFNAHGLRKWTIRWFWVYHTPYFLLYKLGVISQSSFRRPWAAHLSWLFRGYTEEEAQKIWDWVVKEGIAGHWREDVIEILKRHKADGDVVFLVSAGPEPLVKRIGDEVGADVAVGTGHAVHAGRFTGKSIPPVCMDEHKATLTRKRIAALGLELDFGKSHAYADSPGDAGLLEMVGNPIAVYPDAELRELARRRNWPVFEQIKTPG
ncbi:MAG: HAD-IB family hydrolase [Anaerolineae bacterium]|nr:MAG: HAD-IB family hydrolase [Anaerolineae bacterium]